MQVANLNPSTNNLETMRCLLFSFREMLIKIQSGAQGTSSCSCSIRAFYTEIDQLFARKLVGFFTVSLTRLFLYGLDVPNYNQIHCYLWRSVLSFTC